MAEERLGDRIPRLERERQQADRVYNDALSALDRVLEPRVDLPHPPPSYDDTKLTTVNEAWNILPAGPPALYLAMCASRSFARALAKARCAR